MIRVSTRLDGQRVIIDVSDTGLGLAIGHRLIVDLGGELTVPSEAGNGMTFRVAL